MINRWLLKMFLTLKYLLLKIGNQQSSQRTKIVQSFLRTAPKISQPRSPYALALSIAGAALPLAACPAIHQSDPSSHLDAATGSPVSRRL
jgi:hypothetical protein